MTTRMPRSLETADEHRAHIKACLDAHDWVFSFPSEAYLRADYPARLFLAWVAGSGLRAGADVVMVRAGIHYHDTKAPNGVSRLDVATITVPASVLTDDEVRRMLPLLTLGVYDFPEGNPRQYRSLILARNEDEHNLIASYLCGARDGDLPTTGEAASRN